MGSSLSQEIVKGCYIYSPKRDFEDEEIVKTVVSISILLGVYWFLWHLVLTK